MKTFTHPQNKWVMTGALLIALGFTVSFNKSAQYSGSMDFASTEKADEALPQGVSSEIYTAKGVVPVKYIDNGEGKVLAIVPKKIQTVDKDGNVQATTCTTGCTETIELFDVKNKKDIRDLNVKLMQAFEKQLKEKAAKTEKEASTSSEKEKSGDSEKEAVDHFEKIEKKCARHEKGSIELLNCNKDEFIRILSDKKLAKEISPADAMKFFKTEIQTGVAKKLADMRRIRNREVRLAMGQSNLFNSNLDDSSFESSEQIMEEVSSVLTSLVAEVPGKFENVRKGALAAQSEILKAQATQYKNVVSKIENNKDLQYDPRALFVEREFRARDFDTAYASLMPASFDAINTAYANNEISDELQTQYERYMRDFNKNIMKSLFNQSTSSTTLPENFDLAARLAGQRGSITTPSSTINRSVGNGRSVVAPINQLNRSSSQIVIPRMPGQ